MQLGALLMVTARQGDPLTEATPTDAEVHGQVLVKGRARLVCVETGPTDLMKRLPDENGSLKLRFDPSLARAVANKLFDVSADLWRPD